MPPYLNTDNQRMYGGTNFKVGLPRTVGLGQFSSNIIQRKAGYCRCTTAYFSVNPYGTNPGTSTPHIY